MSRGVKQAIIAFFFLVQLAAVWALNHDWTARDDLGEAEALSVHGFYLRECAKECGIDFKHEAPEKLDKRLHHILPIVAAMGASVSVVDYDRDGRPDLYVVTSKEGGHNRLYRNRGDGTFEDVAGRLGVADLNRDGSGVCQGAVWGDFDNDGYEDLFVYKWGRPELYRNLRGQGFERVSDRAGLPKWLNANAAVWLDFDRDGHLDLFIAGYWDDDVDLWQLQTTHIMPTSFQYATNGGRKYLLRNKGDGSFEDVTAPMGIKSRRWTLGAAAVDLCGSGFPDIVLANDYGKAEFLCNKSGRRFVEIGERTGIGTTPESGMNVSFGDVYNSGKLAIYITNISDPLGKLVQGNNLWVPQPHQPGEAPVYLNMARELKVDLGGWSWGAQFGDLNNDGWQDLYLVNGFVSADRTDNYWYEYGLIAGANSRIIQDAATWPAMKGRSLSGYQNKYLWLNRGGEFVQVAQQVGVTDTFDGRAVALVDLFGRGVLDVVVANQKGPLLVYKNTVARDRDWLQLELVGTQSNRSAIGAVVRVFWTTAGSPETMQQVQTVSGGNGYASQNMRRLHFGLGKGAKVEKVLIEWPSGRTQEIKAPATNQVRRITEPKA